MTPALDLPLLVHAVSWSGREPRLVVSTPTSVARDSLPLLDERLAFSVDASGRYCTGRFVADDGRHETCPGARLAASGAQCEQCAGQDDSRFMHHAHRGGFVPESLDRVLAQPHWLYVATFADGTSKVGTAAYARKLIRLDEQGAVRATYVAQCPDGRAVRVFEDAVTEHAGLSQVKHASSKAAALTRALPSEQLDERHAQDVEAAATVLRRHDTAPLLEPWQPPSGHAAFFTHTRVHPFYPHSLDAGEHCFTVRAAVGGAALVAVNDDGDDKGDDRLDDDGSGDDDALALVDLTRLRGRRLTFGAFRSPRSAAQHSLF